MRERSSNVDFYNPFYGDAFIRMEFSFAACRFGRYMVSPICGLKDVARRTKPFKSVASKVTRVARIPIGREVRYIGQHRCPVVSRYVGESASAYCGLVRRRGQLIRVVNAQHA